MERLSAKLARIGKADGYWTEGQIAHWCPACKGLHPFAIETRNHSGAIWTWDNNVERPTFSPSMNIRIGPYPAEPGQPGRTDVCHYFLRGGQIQFLGDCTHDMRGQTVEMPDMPPHWPEFVQRTTPAPEQA